MTLPEPCLAASCRSPIACDGWGYCRERKAAYLKRAILELDHVNGAGRAREGMMGFNTVAVILNDAIGMIGQDASFGASVKRAVRNWHAPESRRDLDVPARGERSVHCNAMSIISMAHADNSQIVVVRGNTGALLREAKALDWIALQQLQECLERHGYKVTKPKRPKKPRAAPEPSP